jgi:glutathione S-transferase
MLEPYHNIISTCSQKVRLCFAEKGLTYVDRRVEFRDGGHLSPEYLKLNPNGVVPTLVHDGNPVIDSSVIMEYLDEAFPETSLTPLARQIATTRNKIANFASLPLRLRNRP